MLYKDAIDILNHKESIANLIYEVSVSKKPHLIDIKDKYIQDTVYTLRFLSISLSLEEPILFKNYMDWFGTLAFYLNFSMDSMKDHFVSCETVFKLSIDHQFINQLMQTWILGTQGFEDKFHSIKLGQLEYDEFLKYLINMESEKAYQYVLTQIEKGTSLKEIYLNLLQPTLYQVGELWQHNIITVAKEHYITAAIQHIIGKLYPLLFANKKKAHHTITAVCAGEELHEIGMRMVADFFEISGWDSIFLGSNIPVQTVVKQLIEFPTDVLAISATTLSHLVEVKHLINTVKNNSDLKDIMILVGGKVFNETPNLWKSVGADVFANDPEQAILLANLYVGEKNA